MLSVFSNHRKSIAYAWGLALSILLMGGMIRGGFCIIDDHTQAHWLGRAGRFPFSEIWPNLMRTEVGSLGHGSRFRPIYWLYTDVEAFILGNNPSLYFALRIVLFGLFLGQAGRIATRCLGLWPALLLMVGVAALSFWSNLWTLSLGPAEQVAVLGLWLLMIGAEAIVRRLIIDGGDIPLWALPVASLGASIASGSKENFIVYGGPVGLLVVAMALAKRLRVSETLLALPPLIIPVLVLYALKTAGSNETDFYGLDNSASHRIHAVLEHRGFVIFWLVSIVIAVFLAVLAKRRLPASDARSRLAIFIFLGLVGFFAFAGLWELFFYNGRLPSNIRYDFPLLLLPLATGLCLTGFVRFAFVAAVEWRWRAVQAIFLIIAALYLKANHADFSLPSGVRAAVLRTTSFRDAFNQLKEQASAHPKWPIVLEVNDPWDFEIVNTFRDWTTLYGVVNPLLMRLDTLSPNATKGSFETKLLKTMQDGASEDGPFPKLANSATLMYLDHECFAVGVDRPAVSPCDARTFELGRFIPE